MPDDFPAAMQKLEDVLYVRRLDCDLITAAIQAVRAYKTAAAQAWWAAEMKERNDA